jgi:putative salt-induced outer membrane protein
MFVNRNSVRLIACVFFAVPVAHAQWTGQIEVGLLAANGNSESKSANAKLDLTHEGSQWRNNIFLSALYGENADFATTERYEMRFQADWKIDVRSSWFGRVRAEADRFSGFAYQSSVATGATFIFIDNPDTKLDASFGAGYRRLQPQVLLRSDVGEVIARIDGEEESEPVATVSSNYEHSFTETTSLTNKLLVEAGSDNTAVQNDIALRVNITKAFALAVGFGVRYNTEPPALAKSTDTLTTINLVYNIL